MSVSRFFIRKPIATIQAETQKSELKRTLSAANLISLGIGCIIGTGIFVMTGQAAAQFAGPGIIISFFMTGICCAFVALCYAELASMLPVSGSAYSYAYASLGEIFAWIMGWLLLLEYGIAGSTVSVGWSGYVVSFLKDFGVIIPPEWAAATGMKVTMANGLEGKAIFNLPAALGLVVVSILLMLGVKESATVNNVIVFIKVSVVILFIAFGMAHINPANWHPLIPTFVPDNSGTLFGHPYGDYGWGTFGWMGVLRGASYIFFAYVGFEAVSTAAQESRNPQKDLPIGIIGSLAICTVLYMLVSLVLTGIVPYHTLNVPAPIAMAVDAIGLPWLAFMVKVGAICGLSSVMLVLMYGQTRIFYTMAHDGLLPPVFSHVHPRFKTPWINTLLVGAISAVVAGMTPIEDLGNLVNLGTLMAFTIICFTVIYLRVKEPAFIRPFKVPFAKITPFLGMASCLLLIAPLWGTFVTLIPYFVLGFFIYFAYGQFNSRLRKAQALAG